MDSDEGLHQLRSVAVEGVAVPQLAVGVGAPRVDLRRGEGGEGCHNGERGVSRGGGGVARLGEGVAVTQLAVGIRAPGADLHPRARRNKTNIRFR